MMDPTNDASFYLPFRLSTAAILEQKEEQTNWNYPHVDAPQKTPITSSFHTPQVRPTHTHHFHSRKSKLPVSPIQLQYVYSRSEPPLTQPVEFHG